MSRNDEGLLKRDLSLFFNIAVKYKAIVNCIVKETGALKKAINYLARRLS